MGDCCKQGYYHKGTPTGTIGEIGGLKTYIATGGHKELEDDKNVKSVVYFIADVHGITLNNNKILADRFAKEIGAKVYLPDFFDGEDLTVQAPTPEARAKFDLGAFIGKYHPREKSWPKVEAALKEIKAKHPSAKVGAVGYCWGAPSCLHLASSSTSKDLQVDAIAFAHGSLVDVKDFDTLSKPSLFITPEHDQMFTEEIRLGGIETTKKLAKDQGLFTKWVYYPNVTHGFAVRGDEGDAFQARAMRDAAQEVISHFKLELV